VDSAKHKNQVAYATQDLRMQQDHSAFQHKFGKSLTKSAIKRVSCFYQKALLDVQFRSAF